MPAKRPTLPARYTSCKLIAYGGMGEVYRATDKTLGRTVAVKLLSERYAKNEEFHARFLREAQTAASLMGEPNVIVIYDVDENEHGVPFIVMEYLPGGTVADRLGAGRVDPDLALAWLGQAAQALDRAHARGVVHRDVKPANLLLAEDDTVRVTDFGIARAADQDTLTAAGTVLGSVGYMSPEQTRGDPSTAASDRYALACVAFELLTGRRPFERESQAAEAAAHATEAPPSPREVDPKLPVAVDAVLARGLAKQPDDRFASGAAFVAALRTALEDIQTAATAVLAPPSLPEPSFTRHATRPRRSAVLLAALALLIAGAWLSWALSGDDGSGGATVVVTRTEQGKTVTEESTVVVTEEEDKGGGPPPPPPGASGDALNDEGFRLLQQGDVDAALPLLESSVAALRGSGSITEAYASYNLASARFALGRCDGVAELLDRSEEVQGGRKEIDRLRRKVQKRCNED